MRTVTDIEVPAWKLLTLKRTLKNLTILGACSLTDINKCLSGLPVHSLLASMVESSVKACEGTCNVSTEDGKGYVK